MTFFQGVGLRLEQGTITIGEAGFMATRNFDGPMTVAEVASGSEAERAGLRVDDIVLEINGKVAGQDSAQEMSRLNPGDAIALKLRGRRGGDREVKWKVGGRKEVSYQLKDLENVTPEQQARRSAWLKGEAQVPRGAQ